MSTCQNTACPGQIVDELCSECGSNANPSLEPIRKSFEGSPALPKRPPQAVSPAQQQPIPLPRAEDLAQAHDAGVANATNLEGDWTAPDSAPRERSTLGAGLVDVPPIPPTEPSAALLMDPVLPEHKRHCGTCASPVGRGENGKHGKAGDVTGVCELCDTPFSFKPGLVAGEVVNDRYEVSGCLAHGAAGWVYLAKDRDFDGRWVVLKGLSGKAGPIAMASDQRTLLGIKHPNIARIYDFFSQPDPVTGVPVDYMALEYVNGMSLKQIALDRGIGSAEASRLGDVISYGLEILRALGYLHSLTLLYCDLKPENVIQTGTQIKLIDLDGVRRKADRHSPILRTRGYGAPELAEHGASVASDIYTVGRTLAVLSTRFAGYRDKYQYTLPKPDEVPVFQQSDSYYRLLVRATHPDPARRFGSADEMAEQLQLILREVVAIDSGKSCPFISSMFGATHGAMAMTIAPPDPAAMATALPMPLIPADEPYTVTETQNEDPTLLIDTLTQSGPHSVAARLRIVSAWIELGDFAAAFGDLEVARNLAADHHDWRLQWYYGLIELAMRRQERARVAFDGVCDMLPGELAPKIALAFCAECQQDYPTASRLYECAWRIDRYSVAAAFGFVRTLLARNALRAAVEVLDSIPHDSPYYVDSQVAAIRIMVSASDTAKVTEKDLVNAARRLDALKLESSQYLELSVQILESALSWIMEGEPGETQESGPASVLNCQLMERDLRRGLERCYRGLAATASTPQLRHALVDQANAIRPVTIM